MWHRKYLRCWLIFLLLLLLLFFLRIFFSSRCLRSPTAPGYQRGYTVNQSTSACKHITCRIFLRLISHRRGAKCWREEFSADKSVTWTQHTGQLDTVMLQNITEVTKYACLLRWFLGGWLSRFGRTSSPLLRRGLCWLRAAEQRQNADDTRLWVKN